MPRGCGQALFIGMSTLAKKPVTKKAAAGKPIARRLGTKPAVARRPLPHAKGTTKDLSALSETFGMGVDLDMVSSMIAARSSSASLRRA